MASSGYAMGNTVRDSVGVENENGKQVILHKVATKENYYSIGRIYSVHPKDIMNKNGSQSLKPGSIIKVPTDRAFQEEIVRSSKQQVVAHSAGFIEYKVGSKETLFAIAKRFNTKVDAIKQDNNLSSNALSIGQLLKIRQGSMANPVASAIGEQVSKKVNTIPSVDSLPQNTRKDTTDSAAADNVRVNANRYGVTQRTEKGVAVWIDDENLDAHKMLALHRTAPVGTVVRIVNPMTGKSAYAKVVGKFTENETTRDVIIVMTKATSDLLGALDKRFQVTIEYGMPNE